MGPRDSILSSLLALGMTACLTPPPEPLGGANPAPQRPAGVAPAAEQPREARPRDDVHGSCAARPADDSTVPGDAASAERSRVDASLVRIFVRNEMGGHFRWKHFAIVLDDRAAVEQQNEPLRARVDDGILVFGGPLPPGEHTVRILVQLQGDGEKELKGYSFDLTATHRLTKGIDRPVCLEIVGYEHGGSTTSLEARPRLRFIEVRAGRTPSRPGTMDAG
jgi:hypothetical protein